MVLGVGQRALWGKEEGFVDTVAREHQEYNKSGGDEK